MDVYNTSIHIMICQDTVSHICHILNLTETMEGDLTVDAVVALLGTVLMPWSLNKSRCYGLTLIPFGSNSFTSDLVRK